MAQQDNYVSESVEEGEILNCMCDVTQGYCIQTLRLALYRCSANLLQYLYYLTQHNLLFVCVHVFRYTDNFPESLYVLSMLEMTQTVLRRALTVLER